MNRSRGDSINWPVLHRLLLFNLLLACLALCGCGKPKHLSTGARTFGLKGVSGCFWIVRGNAISDNQELGATENVLYLLMLCPGISENGYGESIEQRSSYNRYSSFWDTRNGDRLELEVGWDLHTDSVVIEKHRFERARGEVFTIVRRQDGRIVVDQLKLPAGHGNRFAVLDHIKGLKTDVPLFRELKFAEEKRD